MAVTQNTYTGDGTTVLFSFTFPYLETTDIKVSLNGTVTTAYTLANATTIQFNTAPTNGAAIRIYRQTDDSALAATFYPGSAIRSQDLNDNFTQNLYVTQESSNTATTATTTANSAVTTANTALSNSTTAISTANSASASAASAVSTATQAASDAASAVSTATTASATATQASTDAAAAVSTANTAASQVAGAVSTANSAAADAASALSASAAATATANSALSTANTASSNASAAVSTANTANTNATAALNAVANSVQYTLVANVAAIPGSPADGDAIEIADSTGVESFTPLANIPAGYVGDVGLSVRIQYSSSGSTWNWLNYFPNNAESRYLKLAGGTLTGALTLNADPTQNLQAATKQYVDNVANSGGLPLTGGTMTGQILGDNSTSPTTPGYAFDGDANTGLYTTGADELALSTGGVARVTIDSAGAVSVTNSLSVGGQAAVVTNDARLTDARTPTDGSVTDAKVAANAAIAGSKIQAASTSNAGAVQLTDSTSSTSTTTAATPNAVKSAYDLADAALPKVGGTLTGDVTLNAQSDLRFADADSSNWVALQGPATVSSNVTWTLPSADGTSGQVLSTNGSGTLSWATAAAGGASVTTSDTAPSSPSDGDLWYDSVGGRTYVYYDDGNTSQWVDAAPQGGGGSGTSITTGNTTAEVIDTGSDGRFVVTTEGTEALRVDSSRRLLVGTSSARTAVFFNGDPNSNPLTQIEQSGVGAASAGAALSVVRNTTTPGGGAYIVLAKSAGSSNGSVSALSSGNVVGLLTFQAADGTDFVECAQIKSEVDGTPGANDMPGRLVFSTTADGASSPTERMRIGNNGFFRFFDSSGEGLFVSSSQSAGTTYSLFAGLHSASGIGTGTYSVVIRTNGNVLNTNNSYGSLSDIKLKENIVDANSQWGDIKALQVRNYNYKPEIGCETHTQLGLIAQEVELVSPGLVSESPDRDEDGNDLGTVTKSVNYSVLYMKAVKALQEAMERIETLEAQNASQAATIAAIEARLTALEGGN